MFAECARNQNLSPSNQNLPTSNRNLSPNKKGKQKVATRLHLGKTRL